jgi:hypothetical protein
VSPWWLRPTADGPADEDRSETDASSNPSPADAISQETSNPPESTAYGHAAEDSVAPLSRAPFTSADALPEAPVEDADDDVWPAEADDDEDDDEDDDDEGFPDHGPVTAHADLRRALA